MYNWKEIIAAFKIYILVFSSIICLSKLIYAQQEFRVNYMNSIEPVRPYLNYNQYSPETFAQLNSYDINFYMLDLDVSNSSTEITGKGTVYAEVINSPVDTFVIELIDSLTEVTYMVVDSVKLNGQIYNFTHNNHLIKVPVDPPLQIGSYITAEIYYYGNGQATETSGYNGISNDIAFNSSVTYTYSEPFWSRIWWPCKQVLEDKVDSIKILITTDSDCKAGSNGLLTSVVPLPGNKLRYEWKSHYPIAYYLVSFAVGEYIEDITYAQIEGANDSILIQSYLFQDSPYLPMNMVAIEKTKDLMQLYSNLFGEYPFKNEKYGYCLAPHPWGAMEHQTMTTTGYQALDTTAALIGGYYYFWYAAHELAHSWFGNSLTCATWQDVWINEGFASYSEYLAIKDLDSQNNAEYWMNTAHNKVKSMPGGSVYVPYESRYNEDRIFDYRLTYLKGAAIIHMIRFELANDSLFSLTLKNFLDTYKYNVATGLDFKDVLEATTGKDFTDFFNQWYFGEGYPIFTINWTQSGDTLEINSVQTTSTNVTPLFKTHLEIKLNYAGGDTVIKVFQNTNSQLFKIYIPEEVTNISIDPNNWLIDNHSVIHTGIDNQNSNLKSFQLYQNFPNPFNPSTKIKYTVPQSSNVLIKVFDILGDEIETLVNEEKPVGTYILTWYAEGFPSGVYFYQIKAGSFVETKKMVLMK